MCFTDSSLPHHWRPRAKGGVGEELILVLYIVCVGLIVGVIFIRIWAEHLSYFWQNVVDYVVHDAQRGWRRNWAVVYPLPFFK
jgi:hypothetical protein